MFVAEYRNTMRNAKFKTVPVPIVAPVEPRAPALTAWPEATHKRLKMPEWAGDIVYEAAERHGVTAEDVVSTSRRVQIVDARAEAMYRIYEMRKLWPSVSTTKIGGWFDRDYTSVSHLIARHGEEFGLPRLVANYSRLRQGRSPQ